MILQQFLAAARQALGPLVDRKGFVFFSGPETLRAGDLYVLGLNPGGDPKDHPRVRESLESWPGRPGWNAYLDEEWWDGRRYAPGQHPFQKRLTGLARELGYDLRAICASNLIFSASRDARGLRVHAEAEQCWPVHRLILDIVRPTALLVFGNGQVSPYRYLLGRYGRGALQLRSGRCKAFGATVAGRPVLIIGVPRLSRFEVPPEDLAWMVRLLAEAKSLRPSAETP